MTRKHISLLVAILMVLAIVPMGATAAGSARTESRTTGIPMRDDVVVDGALLNTGFENTDELADWRIYDVDGDDNYWGRYQDSGYAHGGEYFLGSESSIPDEEENWTDLTPDNWLVTAEFTVPNDGNTYYFTYYARSYFSGNYAESMTVLIGESGVAYDDEGIDVSAWNTLVNHYTVPAEFTQGAADLTPYAGKTVRAAFRHYNTAAGYLLFVDDVSAGLADVPDPTEPPEPTEPPAELEEGYTRVILTVGDVWGDGTGYQMLIDADANAYGSTIPATGGLTSSGNASDAIYAEFEYKIPTNADGAMSTSNIIINNSYSIDVPAGVYDWCITNPTPGDRIWIASEQGNVGGRQDDYEFIEGCTYEFVVSLMGSNDGVNVTITGENAPEVPVPVVGYYFESDDEFNLFTLVDSDGDGRNWKRKVGDSQYAAFEGTGCAYSASYWSGNYKANTNANNWLVTPAIDVPDIDPTITYYAKNYHSSYLDNLAVYIGTSTDVSAMTVLVSSYTPGPTYGKTEIDLSDYAGQTVYIAFQHTGNDMWALMLDQIEVWGKYQTDEPITHTVTFADGLTDEIIAEVEVEDGAAATAPAVPEHTGYTFVGWDEDFSNVVEDMLVIALYEPNSYTLTINYVDEEGNPVADPYVTDVLFNDPYSVPSPEVEGYTTETTVVEGFMDEEGKTITVVYVADEVPPIPGSLLGDANCDGQVTMADVTALIAKVMNAGDLTELGLINADANQDGEVNILDAAAIYAIAFNN